MVGPNNEPLNNELCRPLYSLFSVNNYRAIAVIYQSKKSKPNFTDFWTADILSPDQADDDFDFLVNELPNNIDLICFQEIFNEKAWTILNEKLEDAGYRHFLYDPHIPMVKSKTFHFFPAGKVLWSRLLVYSAWSN